MKNWMSLCHFEVKAFEMYHVHIKLKKEVQKCSRRHYNHELINISPPPFTYSHPFSIQKHHNRGHLKYTYAVDALKYVNQFMYF